MRSRLFATALAGAVALVATLTSWPASAAETAGTLKKNVSSVTAASEVTFTARFPTNGRRPVVLQRRADSGWAKVTNGRTNRRGKVVFAVVAPSLAGSYSYRVKAPRVRKHGRVLKALKTPATLLGVTAPTTPTPPGSPTLPPIPGLPQVPPPPLPPGLPTLPPLPPLPGLG